MSDDRADSAGGTVQSVAGSDNDASNVIPLATIKRAAGVARSMVPSLFIFLPVLVASADIARHYTKTVPGMFSILGGVIVAVFGFAIITQKRLDRAYNPLSLALATERPIEEDPTTIGTLLDYVQGGLTLGKDVAAAADRLSNLLGSLKPGAVCTLNRRQQTLLNSLVVESPSDRQLKAAALLAKRAVAAKVRPTAVTALGIVGDSKTVKVLMRFIDTTDDKTLKTAAKRSLAQVESRE